MDIVPLVKTILEDNPATRDDDGLLAYEFFIRSGNAVKMDNLVEFIKSNKQETISRMRRILQNKYENLRGDKYIERRERCNHITVKMGEIDIHTMDNRTLFQKLTSFSKPKGLRKVMKFEVIDANIVPVLYCTPDSDNMPIIDIEDPEDLEDEDDLYDRLQDMAQDARLDELIEKEGEDGLPLLGDHD